MLVSQLHSSKLLSMRSKTFLTMIIILHVTIFLKANIIYVIPCNLWPSVFTMLESRTVFSLIEPIVLGKFFGIL